MDPHQAMRLAKEHKMIFIDVRESKEQQVSMLPEAITAKAYLQNPDKYKAYLKIAYCTIAYRSGKFAQKLKYRGINIFNMRGGILAWVHDGGKVYSEHRQTNRIHVYGPDGALERIITRPDYQAVKRTGDEVERFRAMYSAFTRWNRGSTFKARRYSVVRRGDGRRDLGR